MLNLKSGEHVLDVGAGIGGGEFYMAQVRKCKIICLLTYTAAIVLDSMLFACAIACDCSCLL